MKQAKPKFAKYLFVCENIRQDKASCAPAGMELCAALKQAIFERGCSETIRVSKSGCLDSCSDGPNILLMPDCIMFHHVRIEDIQRITDVAITGSSQ